MPTGRTHGRKVNWLIGHQGNGQTDGRTVGPTNDPKHKCFRHLKTRSQTFYWNISVNSLQSIMYCMYVAIVKISYPCSMWYHKTKSKYWLKIRQLYWECDALNTYGGRIIYNPQAHCFSTVLLLWKIDCQLDEPLSFSCNRQGNTFMKLLLQCWAYERCSLVFYWK